MSKRNKTTKDKEKQDIAEKVREIKLRQQNWLKQRESALKESCDSSGAGEGQSASSRNSNGSLGLTRSKEVNTVVSSSVSEPPVHAKNARFKSWRSAQMQKKPSGTSQRASTDRYGDNEDIGSDHSDASSSCSELRRIEQSESSSARSSVRSQHLTPDMFDVLADQIAERVKRELKTGDGPQNNYLAKTKLYDNSFRGESDLKCHVDKGLESHYCSQCRNLMVPPVHTPMLIIPCGHCVCQACGQGQPICPQCSSQVTSLTCNIMLQQIILEFNSKRQQQAHGTKMENGYCPQKYSSGSKGYADEYQTLTIRHEVLETESRAIKEKLSVINKDMGQARNTMKNISREEEKIEKEILALEQKRKILGQHKEEYAQKVERLESQHFEEANRLALLEESKKSLEKEMDKVKILAGH